MITETITLLENTLAAFAMAVRSADINWDYKLSAEKWSNKEILGHLTDSAQVNLQRFVRCTYEEKFKLVYDQNKWVEGQAYHSADVKDLFTLWMALNKQILNVLNNYPAERSDAQCDTGRYEIELHSIEFLAADYVIHLRHHLEQILEG